MPYCKLCAKYLDQHPEAVSPTNSGGAALNRLLEVVEIGGLGDQAHTTLPGRELHRRAQFEAGIVPPGARVERPPPAPKRRSQP